LRSSSIHRCKERERRTREKELAQYTFSSASTQFMTVVFLFMVEVIDIISTKHNYTFQKKRKKTNEAKKKDFEIKRQYLVKNDR
jgi:hypothetical protein